QLQPQVDVLAHVGLGTLAVAGRDVPQHHAAGSDEPVDGLAVVGVDLLARSRGGIDDDPDGDRLVAALQVHQPVVGGVLVDVGRVDVHRHQHAGAFLGAGV